MHMYWARLLSCQPSEGDFSQAASTCCSTLSGQPDGQIGDLGCLDLADLELRHPLFPQLAQPFQRRAAQARFLAQGHEAFHIEIGTDLVFRNGNLAHSLSLRASG